jgi:hypothetical protein
METIENYGAWFCHSQAMTGAMLSIVTWSLFIPVGACLSLPIPVFLVDSLFSMPTQILWNHDCKLQEQ